MTQRNITAKSLQATAHDAVLARLPVTLATLVLVLISLITGLTGAGDGFA